MNKKIEPGCSLSLHVLVSGFLLLCFILPFWGFLGGGNGRPGSAGQFWMTRCIGLGTAQSRRCVYEYPRPGFTDLDGSSVFSLSALA